MLNNYISLLSTFLTIFDIMSSDSTLLTFDIFYHSTFCHNRPFLLSTLFLFGVLSHSTLCPIQHFVRSTFFTIRHFVIRHFVPFGVLSFDVFYFRHLLLRHFVGEPYMYRTEDFLCQVFRK
jgi:hypothetical protein